MRVNRDHRLCCCVNSSSVCLSLSLSLMSLSLCIRHTCLGKLLRISCLEHVINDLVRSKINFLVGPQEPLSGNCQGMEFCMGMFGHVTHLDSLPKLSVRAPWRAGEMLPEQNQRVDIPTLARTAHKGPLQKRLEEYLC